jgi:hypothetical protein
MIQPPQLVNPVTSARQSSHLSLSIQPPQLVNPVTRLALLSKDDRDNVHAASVCVNAVNFHGIPSCPTRLCSRILSPSLLPCAFAQGVTHAERAEQVARGMASFADMRDLLLDLVSGLQVQYWI